MPATWQEPSSFQAAWFNAMQVSKLCSLNTYDYKKNISILERGDKILCSLSKGATATWSM